MQKFENNAENRRKENITSTAPLRRKSSFMVSTHIVSIIVKKEYQMDIIRKLIISWNSYISSLSKLTAKGYAFVREKEFEIPNSDYNGSYERRIA